MRFEYEDEVYFIYDKKNIDRIGESITYTLTVVKIDHPEEVNEYLNWKFWYPLHGDIYIEEKFGVRDNTGRTDYEWLRDELLKRWWKHGQKLTSSDSTFYRENNIIFWKIKLTDLINIIEERNKPKDFLSML